MWSMVRDVLARSSAGEIIGAVVIAVSFAALVVGAFAYGRGDEIAFFGIILAFAAGTTGLGVHVAGREARLRRERR